MPHAGVAVGVIRHDFRRGSRCRAVRHSLTGNFAGLRRDYAWPARPMGKQPYKCTAIIAIRLEVCDAPRDIPLRQNNNV